MRSFTDVIERLGPVFAAILLMLVIGAGIVLVAYSTWQLIKTRHQARHVRHAPEGGSR